MFKRLRWMSVGASVGFGASVWLNRKVRHTMARYTPDRVSTDLAARARGLGQDVVEAVSEGREAMRRRERELRAQFAPSITGVDDAGGRGIDPPPVRIDRARQRASRAIDASADHGPTSSIRQLRVESERLQLPAGDPPPDLRPLPAGGRRRVRPSRRPAPGG